MAKATIRDLEGGAALCAWFKAPLRSTTLHYGSWNFARAHRVVWSPTPFG
jgi:hypothetical protein